MKPIKTLALSFLVLLPSLSFADVVACDSDQHSFCFKLYNRNNYIIVPRVSVVAQNGLNVENRLVALDPAEQDKPSDYFVVQDFEYAEKASVKFDYQNEDGKDIVCEIKDLDFGGNTYINADGTCDSY